MAAFAAPAGAQTTGGATLPVDDAEPQSAPPLSSPPPGVKLRPAPTVRSRRCVRDCAQAGSVRTGSVLRLRGRNLARTYEVTFLGAEGADDDVSAAPLMRRRNAVDVRVPLGAVSGAVVAADRDGTQSAPGEPLALDTAAAVAAGPAIEVQAQARRAFIDAESPIEIAYVLRGAAPARVKAELLRVRDGAVVETWDVGEVPPGTPQALSWDGTAGGRAQAPGRYLVRVTAETATGVPAVSSQADPEAPNPAEFRLLGHEFPVRGPHGYGELAASFGGGRGHQGHDVFASCGTPIVAARGGVVAFKEYHGRAGHYIVVDGEQTAVDYTYMHMRSAALVDQGDRVRTGQLIGYVGETGRAFGCHLHFEMWDGPGWYEGGSPFDPLTALRAWDRRT